MTPTAASGRRRPAPPILSLDRRIRLHDVTRRWVLIGLCGWTAILGISFADIAFQTMGRGSSFADSWPGVLRMSLLWAGPGAVLSVGVFLLFRRVVRPDLRLGERLGRYSAVGLLYWLSWSAIQAALLPWAAGIDPSEMPFGSRLTWAAAGLAFNGALLYAAMAGIHAAAQNAAAARLQERRGTELRRELERARTSALSARLNPHFLFNTLHVASGLMGRDLDGSRQVLADLRGLLSQALERDDGGLVPLQDELRLAEGYLRIQRARFGDRLEISSAVAPEARSVLVPPLLLQPLVENAVQHGIALAPAGECVRISAHLRSDRLHVVVEDTGSGEPGEMHPPVEQVGLGGVRARLGLIFGDAAAATFSPIPGGGFRAALSFPTVSRAAPRAISGALPTVAGHAE